MMKRIIERKNYYDKKLFEDRNPLKICEQMWISPQINWDGKLLGCCVTIWDHYGNVFEKPLMEVMRGKRYSYALGMLKGEKPPREDIPCVRCRLYLTKIFPSGPFSRLSLLSTYGRRYAADSLHKKLTKIRSTVGQVFRFSKRV